jgi:ligand-binding SRPBCC domain-containing protein
MYRPRHFRDSMVRGAFRRFVHDHYFELTPNGTTAMKDVFVYEAPLGPLGRLADRLFLTAYMRRLLSERNAVIKRTAETGILSS